MQNFIKEMFSNEPHSFDDIAESLNLDSALETDLISLLEKHHDYIEESIEVLMDQDATEAQKKLHLKRFYRLVEMHGKAEEETLYVYLKNNADKFARIEGLGGKEEHDLAFQLESELTQLGYPSQWNEEIEAKAIRAAALLKNHIKEEESMMFQIAERYLSAAEFESMRSEYIQKCKLYLSHSESIFGGEAKPMDGYEGFFIH